MKHAIFVVAAVLLAGPVFGQWSEEQQQVWAFVEQSWVDDSGKTGEWPRGYAVEAYTSWGEEEAMPQNLAEADAGVRFRDESGSTAFYQVKPTTISIDGDTAVVNYYATVVAEDSDGEREREVTAITETLISRDGEWRYFASSGWSPDLD